MHESKTIKNKEHSRKDNSYDNANFLCRSLFLWPVSFMIEAIRRNISEDDICKPLRDHQSDHCERKMKAAWENELERCKYSKRKPKLHLAILRMFGPTYLVHCILILLQETCPFLQMYFLRGLLNYFNDSLNRHKSFHKATINAVGVTLCGFVRTYLVHNNNLRGNFLGVNIRVAVTTLLYQKVLKLNKAKKANLSTGLILNLFSIDGRKLESFLFFGFYVIVSPLQWFAATSISYYLIGWPALPGALFSLLCYPLQMWISKMTYHIQHEMIKKTDVRVRIMNEIISGIKVLKMYAWENSFAKLVSAVRQDELNSSKKAHTLRGLAAINIIYRSRMALFLTVLSYCLANGDIDATTVYVITALLNTYQITLSVFMTNGVRMTGDALQSLRRLTDFLVDGSEYDYATRRMSFLAEKEEEENIIGGDIICDKRTEHQISLSNMTASWSDEIMEPSLANIDLDFPCRKLTAIVGSVGSGKSTLLQVIIGELSIKTGSLYISGNISYAAQEPWVFQGSIRENVIFGQPYDPERYARVIKACALDRDITILPDGDKTIVGERGVMLSGGQKARVSLARTVYRKANAYLLDDPLSAVDASVGKLIFEECIRGFLRDKTVLLVTHQIQMLESVERIVWLESGKVKVVSSYSELRGIYEILEGDTAVDVAMSEDVGEDAPMVALANDIRDKPAMKAEHEMFGKLKTKAYTIFFKAGGPWYASLLFVCTFLVTQLAASFFDLSLNHWVKIEELNHERHVLTGHKEFQLNRSSDQSITLAPHPDETLKTFIIVISTAIGVMIVFAIVEVAYFSYFCHKVSLTLHNKMFTSVLRTSMSFFNSNTSGRILNRFSSELSTIDATLVDLLLSCLVLGLFLLGSFAMVIAVHPVLIIPVAVSLSLMIIIVVLYSRTSQQIKRMESSSRSPVMGHVNKTLDGLSTVRVFNAESFLTSEFYKHLDFNSAVQFQSLSVARMIGFMVDLMGFIFFATVVTFLLLFPDMIASNVGLCITQIVSFGNMLQFLLKQVVDLDNAFTSVDRVAEYTELPCEINGGDEEESNEVGTTWPSEGKINFEDVSFSYQPNGPKVLKNLNFTILPKEKIGIVGRTGAGKSSLISALFRMAEIEGKIKIDNVDTSTMSLHQLRSRISIIPQDPVLFSGTLRKNIDPFNKYTDDLLWTALEEVELKDTVSDSLGGLDSKISEGGGNLSVGEKQLVCLARAIIRNNKVLVLDEATANVDHETDRLIQKTIRSKFSDKTVLTVAHRLNTVMDSDRILVVSEGNIVEFDHPYILLQKESGYLKEMVQKCGKNTENLFRATAKENYDRRTHNLSE